MWMVRLRVSPSKEYTSRFKIVSVIGGKEIIVYPGLQKILDDAVQTPNHIQTEKWVMRTSESLRSMPPALTVEMPRSQCVLELRDGFVQWVKEPLQLPGTSLDPARWFCSQKVLPTDMKELSFLEGLQRHLFPLGSLCGSNPGHGHYQVNIVTGVMKDVDGFRVCPHLRYSICGEVLLCDVFAAFAGTNPNNRLALRKIMWTGANQQPLYGQLYSYANALRKNVAVGDLGWVENSSTWLLPGLLNGGKRLG